MSHPFGPIDFRDYHERQLPEVLASGRALLAARGTADLAPLAIRERESGRVYTYRPGRDEVSVEPGDAAAATVIELARASWEGLVHDVESAPSLLYGGDARGLRGDPMDFVLWEPALRAMYCGRPVYDPDSPLPDGPDGRPLDPHRSFTLADADGDLRHFLSSMGYLLLRDVFQPDEVAALQQEAEELRAAAEPGGQDAWWGESETGAPMLLRVLSANTKPRLGALHDDARIVRLSQIPPEELEAKDRGGANGVTVLWKQPGCVSGLGDLPWHRDCGMGGHALMCPTVNCSVFLGPANPDAGDLRFLPASWQSGVRFADGADSGAASGISIDARPGDVSLHYGDVVHAAPPPESKTGPFRTSVLLGWGKPGFEPHSGRDHYNDVLFQGDANEVPDMREMARRSGADGDESA